MQADLAWDLSFIKKESNLLNEGLAENCLVSYQNLLPSMALLRRQCHSGMS